MTTKHTPGPWRIEQNSQIWADSPDPEITDPVYVAQGQCDTTRAQQKANARLIAAAPDLLASAEEDAELCNLILGLMALRVKAGTASAAERSACVELSGRNKRRRAAIAKATGE